MDFQETNVGARGYNYPNPFYLGSDRIRAASQISLAIKKELPLCVPPHSYNAKTC
jgi:hypothetical protein